MGSNVDEFRLLIFDLFAAAHVVQRNDPATKLSGLKASDVSQQRTPERIRLNQFYLQRLWRTGCQLLKRWDKFFGNEHIRDERAYERAPVDQALERGVGLLDRQRVVQDNQPIRCAVKNGIKRLIRKLKFFTLCLFGKVYARQILAILQCLAVHQIDVD